MTKSLKELENKINRLDDSLTGLSQRVDELVSKQVASDGSASNIKDSITELRTNFVSFSECVHDRLKYLLERN